MSSSVYLVFGDLHGRVLPAFRLATAWARDHQTAVAAILQVGDLGYFPDPSRFDKATKRHAEIDPLEIGVMDVTEPSKLADDVFGEIDCPDSLWFTAGNHEDYEALLDCGRLAPRQPAYPVDAYLRLLIVRDGCVAELPGGLKVGAIWGIDGSALNSRRNVPPAARIKARSATQLAGQSFNILLTHDGPRDAVYPDTGSADISALIQLAQPQLAFFGHYGTEDREILGRFGRTRVFHCHGFELRKRDGCAESASVGCIRWDGVTAEFEYLSDQWLMSFTRENWKGR